MDRIIEALEKLGVEANATQIRNWCNKNNRAADSLTDADIVALAQSLGGKLAEVPPRKLAKPAPIALPDFTAQPVTQDLAAVQAQGFAQGERDASLLFEASDRGYAEGFSDRFRQSNLFRQSIIQAAADALTAA